MTCWRGQALSVDLSSGQSRILPLSANVLRHTLGGRGLAGHLLRTSSLSLDLPSVCLACGPFGGHQVQTAERLVAVFRSPLTKGIFDASSSSSFACDLKAAGFDALVLTGAAKKLSHLQLTSEGATLTPVPELRGLNTSQTFLQVGSLSALTIGPAGENQVPYASVVASHGEPLSRGGLGALLGRMNLKLLSASGNHAFHVADEQACLRAKADIQRLFNASPYLYGPLGIGRCGTAALLDLTQAQQMLPSANFKQRSFEHAEQFSAAQLKAEAGYVKNPCPGCHIGCRKKSASGILPEYDSLAHFSALLGLPTLAEVIAADRSCHQLGLDPVSAAVIVADYWADRQEVTGSDLSALLEMIAQRRDQGGALAEGLQSLWHEQGRSQDPFCVKKLELPAFDPRGAYGFALALSLSSCGEYRHAQTHFHELLRKPVPTERLSFSGKARIILQAENATAACDSLSVCRHTLIAVGLEEYAALLTAISGMDFTAADLASSGEQTILREHWLNQQFGFSAAQDVLPTQFFSEAACLESGDGLLPIKLEDFMRERSRYYLLRGLTDAGELLSAPEEPL